MSVPAKEIAVKTRDLVCQNFHKPKRIKGKSPAARLKTRVPAGKAATGPPLTPLFGGHGLKAMDFIKDFNEKTGTLFKPGVELRVRVWAYRDRSFESFIAAPSTTWLMKTALNIEKFGADNSEIPRVITPQMCYHIAELIRPADDETGIVNWTRKVAGVARSMGIVVVDKDTEVQTEVVESSLHQEDADDWIFK
jgi:large subunit ribosomal protein L11|uniref:Ribosomal protein L11 C-terminal domain-containing protein n=1 Tax=Eutreptiella gymnastica TaxID=73025 RepID=A0A7S4GJX4_9EUGL